MDRSSLSQSTHFWQFINVSYKDSVVVWPSVDGRPVCGAPEFEFAHWLAVATIFCFRVVCFCVCVECALFYLVLFNVLPLTPAYAPPSRRRSNDGRIRYDEQEINHPTLEIGAWLPESGYLTGKYLLISLP